MTRKIVTCSRAETISGVMDLMTAGKFRHLPVVDEGRLIGIVSIGDVVKHRVQESVRSPRPCVTTTAAPRSSSFRRGSNSCRCPRYSRSAH